MCQGDHTTLKKIKEHDHLWSMKRTIQCPVRKVPAIEAARLRTDTSNSPLHTPNGKSLRNNTATKKERIPGASEGILGLYGQPPEVQFTRGVRVSPLEVFEI